MIKHVINDTAKKTKTAGDFQMQVTADNPAQATFGKGGRHVGLRGRQRYYSVDEGAHTKRLHQEPLEENCSGTIANGETKTCTITNNDQAGTLTW